MAEERPLTPNVLQVYDMATEGEREYGEAWYPLAHKAASRIAVKYDVDMRVVAAVISALSPSNRWHQNLFDAERFVEAWADGRNKRKQLPPVTSVTYSQNWQKAWDLLRGLYDDPVEAFETGTAEKTRAFYLAIAEPYSNTNHVVVDGHAWNIATNRRRPLKEVPNLSKGRYRKCSRTYVRASHERGVTPQAMQATCWIVWRRLTNWQLEMDDLLLTTERM